MSDEVASRPAFGLAPDERALLRKRFEQAVRRARRRRSAGVLAAITVPVGRDVDPSAVALLCRRPGELRSLPLPLLDPDPVGRYTVAASAPPEHYEGAVARAVERIRAGDIEKIVLAREVQVHAPSPPDVAAVYGVLREGFPSCFCF